MLIPEDFAQVNLIFSGNAVPTGAQCTFGVDVSAFSGNPGGAAAAIGTSWGTNIMPNLSSTIALASVLIKYGPSETGPSAEVSVDVAGGKQAFSDPPNTALIIRKHTAAGGRTGRGRMFVPGAYSDDIDSSGVVSSELIGFLEADLLTFLGELTTADLPPVLLHAEGSPVITPTPITAFTVDAKAGTQRRRLRR